MSVQEFINPTHPELVHPRCSCCHQDDVGLQIYIGERGPCFLCGSCAVFAEEFDVEQEPTSFLPVSGYYDMDSNVPRCDIEEVYAGIKSY